MQNSEIGVIKDYSWYGIESFSSDNSFSHCFHRSSFDYSKKFLGKDTCYRIYPNEPACLAESEKGKGLILGIRK